MLLLLINPVLFPLSVWSSRKKFFLFCWRLSSCREVGHYQQENHHRPRI